MKRLLLCVFGLLCLSGLPAGAQIVPIASPTGPVMAGPYVVIDAGSGETLMDRGPARPGTRRRSPS
jgi:hypothetical protein